MKQIKKIFLQSCRELKEIRCLAETGMLIGIGVVLGFYKIVLSDFLQISVSFLAQEMCGYLFGPVVAAGMGGVTDLIGCVVRPTGTYFPGFTLNAMLGGVIYGLVLYKKSITITRVFVATLLVNLLVHLCLNTLWLSVLYGEITNKTFMLRGVKQLLMLPVETMLFYVVTRSFLRVRAVRKIGRRIK